MLPWQFKRESYFQLSLLILALRSPGKDTDVYLQPLVDELVELWDVAIQNFNVVTKYFKVHATLMWTISDFPAYKDLSIWVTKGKLACPYYHNETFSIIKK